MCLLNVCEQFLMVSVMVINLKFGFNYLNGQCQFFLMLYITFWKLNSGHNSTSNIYGQYQAKQRFILIVSCVNLKKEYEFEKFQNISSGLFKIQNQEYSVIISCITGVHHSWHQILCGWRKPFSQNCLDDPRGLLCWSARLPYLRCK